MTWHVEVMENEITKGCFVKLADGRIARALSVYSYGFAKYRVGLEVPVGDGSLDYPHVDAAKVTPVYGPIGPVRGAR